MKIRFRDIRTWLFIFFALRMIGIQNPPLEVSHSWRQASGLMVARGFLEVDNNILYPRREDHEGTTGIVGFEFPIMNYSHYALSAAFGYTHWYSRLVVLLISSLGLWFFYLLVKRMLNEPKAFYSTMVLITSVWFTYSRKTMPDVFSVSLVTIGIYCAVRYLDEHKWYQLLAFFILATVGMLSKIPAVMILGFLLLPLLQKGILKKESLAVISVSIVGLSAVVWWYFVWNLHLATEFGNFYNIGFPISEGIKVLAGSIPTVLNLISHATLLSYLFFVLSVVGITIAIRKSNRYIILWVAPVVLGFVLYAMKSGEIFLIHHYYMVPIAPVMAIFAGVALSKLKKRRWAMVLLAVGMTEGVLNQQHDLFIKDSEQYKLSIEQIMNDHVPKDAWVGISSTDKNHLLMYLAHRKGWMLLNEEVVDEDVLAERKRQGCEYLVIDKHIQSNRPNLDLIHEDDHFVVMKL